MRKPHVFISSRLKLGPARQQIKQLLEDSGLSAEIYERDSTPASEPATYLRDIIEADFVIFVLDDSYGEPRKATGLSGLHEEWNRVREHRIPNHVYLKRKPGKSSDRRQKQFIHEELVSREISYFYFTSKKTLLDQIRYSLVKLVLDVSRSWRYRARLDLPLLAADIVQRDHETFCQWEKTLITAFEYEQRFPQYVTDIWGSISDLFPLFNPEKVGPFIDCKAQELFTELLLLVHDLSEYGANHSVGAGKQGGAIPILGTPTDITVYVPQPPLPHDFFGRREERKKQIRAKFEETGGLIRRRYTRYAQSS